MVKITINDTLLEVSEGTTVLEAARKVGIAIPTLCYYEAVKPYGGCRLCLVEVTQGERTQLTTSCTYPVSEGLHVVTESPDILEARRLVIDLLLSRCPGVPELQEMARQLGVEKPSFAEGQEDCILCGKCVAVCHELQGAAAIGMVGRGAKKKVMTPFGEFSQTCRTCGACEFVCPTGHIKDISAISGKPAKPKLSEFNEGLNTRGNIYRLYPQAMPSTPAIDRENCIKFLTGNCGACARFCPADAIDYDQKDEKVSLKVGSVILAPGFAAFDPSRHETYHYTQYPNVVTSLQFERILSPTGPYGGHLRRPSDEKELKKIAWLQCIGSREIHHCDHGYCSSVCCMYAIKEAVIAKEHAGHDLECAIFYMDMRTLGKDFERYYNDAKEKHGVRFIRSRVPTVERVRGSEDLLIPYVSENGDVVEERFDMVVLSVGMETSSDVLELAKKLEINLSKGQFCNTSPFRPVKTSREGIYVCGAFQGPKDIPQSVMQASAAACAASMDLSVARWEDTKMRQIPEEIDVSASEPRIGVFVCNCGTNIGGVVNVAGVVQYATALPHVVHVEQNLFTCAQDTQDRMKSLIQEHHLNRVVVAACSPRTHEPLFQETLQACGLNKFLFEMANIRNQDSWVHSNDPASATDKAMDLVRMAVARAAFLRPLKAKKIPINKRALVIGGGIAGMTAALSLANQGFEAVLIEKEAHLGGLARDLTHTLEGDHIPEHLLDLVDQVTHHDKIQVLTESLIVGFNGFKGNFTTEVMVGPGIYERKIDHGVVIVATGGTEYQPKEFLYGQDRRVLTQIEMGKRLEERGAEDLEHVVMIQCVGSRNEDFPNCSRICCQSAVKNALHIKELNPSTEVYVLYRDMRTDGELEYYYSEARRQWVHFLNFNREEPPEVAIAQNGLRVTFKDQALQRKVTLPADLLVLSAGARPADTEELASILKLPRNEDGYFMEAHVKLRPVDMSTEGVYVCGTAHSPKLISESIAQAMAAASRAAVFLSQPELTLSVVTAKVDQERCASCLICVRSCPYGVPRINKDGVSEIDEASCRGCGICASECPAKVIQLNWYEDDQVLSKVDALLEGVLP